MKTKKKNVLSCHRFNQFFFLVLLLLVFTSKNIDGYRFMVKSITRRIFLDFLHYRTKYIILDQKYPHVDVFRRRSGSRVKHFIFWTIYRLLKFLKHVRAIIYNQNVYSLCIFYLYRSAPIENRYGYAYVYAQSSLSESRWNRKISA